MIELLYSIARVRTAGIHALERFLINNSIITLPILELENNMVSECPLTISRRYSNSFIVGIEKVSDIIYHDDNIDDYWLVVQDGGDKTKLDIEDISTDGIYNLLNWIKENEDRILCTRCYYE